MKRYVFVLFLLSSSHLFSQDALQQRVIGRVADKILHASLPGAGIILLGKSDSVTTTSDSTGLFVFEHVSPGRYVMRVSYTGYQSHQQEVLVISARGTEVNIFLEEIPNVLDEVEISERTTSPEMGMQSITIEKALRVPANFFDPVRVITSYPGVMATNDQNNTIIIRGNSPAGLLWRINGLDVVNPNHLANAGTFSDKPAVYGGGVNIISAQLLDRTEFYSGTLPVRYGNALSGAVDMSLRAGNKRERHYTAQASLLGLDASAEGPIGKKQNTSFLVNYRYSTVGLLSAMGVKFGDEDILFHDLTFSMDSKLSKERRLSFFGFYGSSKNEFEHKDSLDWEVDKDRYDIVYESENIGAGLTFNQSIEEVNISSGIAVSGSDQARTQLASPQLEAGKPDVMYDDNYSATKLLVSAFGRLTAKVNSTILETGINVNYLQDDLEMYSQVGISSPVNKSGMLDGFLIQPYAQWRIFLSEKWIAQTGMRYAYYTYNQTGALEPRISLEYFPAFRSSVKFSYNLVSQQQQAGTYLNNNKELELSKSHHIDLGYLFSTDNGFKVSATTYYQMLFDVPVQKIESSYSSINAIEVFGSPGLVSEGTGENYGIEALVEKSFFDKSYFILGSSWYKSTYKGSDDIKRSTRFDGNYSVNLTYGKEWSRDKTESLRTFGISSRLLYLGGLRESPIIADANSATTVFDESKAFENKLSDYFRLDLRLNWRKDKKGYTRTIAIDIQNVLNIQNEAYHYYDHVLNKVSTQYQLGVIPVLVYRIDF